MALKKRTVINRCEVLATGDIQVREAVEIYDTLTGEIESQTYHRFVVASGDATPAKVQTFLDASKANG